jgi:hypothetical protein
VKIVLLSASTNESVEVQFPVRSGVTSKYLVNTPLYVMVVVIVVAAVVVSVILGIFITA